MIEEAGFDTFQKFVDEAVSKKVDLVATDENPNHRNLKKAGYPQDHATHGKYEWVRGRIHTQSIESFWSLLKRGIVGTYHHVSDRYLPLYLNEFSWRFNNRKNPDIFLSALAGC